ncbi:MAG: hypothetical protein ACT4NY_18575 [Pseudonocardiales bacterium]
MTMGTAEHVFHEGDHALLRFGTTDVKVEVIEERGAIGVRGRRLVRVRMPVTASDPIEFEVPESDLHPLTSAA